MPSPAYATISGATQGKISENANSADSIGNSYQDAHTNELTVLSFDTRVAIPRDPHSGQPAGLRVHKPAQICVAFSKSSPMLWQALATGEVLQISIAFYRTSLTGQQEKYFTISYEDCILVEGHGYIPHVLDQNVSDHPHSEAWDFTYRKVEWTHDKAGTSGNDDWRSPRNA